MMLKVKNLIDLSLILFFCSTIVQVTHVIGRVFFMELFLMLFLGMIYFYIGFIKKFSLIFTFLLFLIFVSIFSSIYTGELVVFYWLFYALLIMSMLLIGAKISSSQLYNILYFFLIFHLIFQVLGLLFGKRDYLLGYQGFFHNPNNFGVFSAYCFYISTILYIQGYKKLFSIFSLFFSFTFVVISASRLSLMLVIMSFLSFYLYSYIFSQGYKKLNYYLAPFFSILIIIGLWYLGFFNNLLEKSINTKDSENITNGRYDLWVNAYDNLSFFGSGSGYYRDGDLSTHNNFLHIGVVYGVITLLIFLLIYFYSFFYSFYNLVKFKKPIYLYALLSFSFTILFWFFEIGSSLFFVWISFLIYGFSVNGEKR